MHSRWWSGLLFAATCVAATVCGAQSFSFDHTIDERFSVDTAQVLGQARWRMQGDELIGQPLSNEGGWLFFEHTLQDVGFYARFKCEAECATGVLLRAQPRPEGGLSGVFVSLQAGELRSYRMLIDASGKEISRTELQEIKDTMTRSAPGKVPLAPAPTAAGALAAKNLGLPLVRQSAQLRPGWNAIEALVDTNLIRTWLNNLAGMPAGDIADDGAGFGRIGLYVGGKGAVHFKGVGYRDLSNRGTVLEKTGPWFDVQRVDDFMYAWGVATADINRDGIPDIVTGGSYFLGPTYEVRREFTLARTNAPSHESPIFQVILADDFTGDGWPDILDVSFRRPAKLYVNPRGESRRWDMHRVVDVVGGELALLEDIDGDGKKEVLLYQDEGSAGYIAIARPRLDNPTGPWQLQPITPRAPWGQHGMGVGDINQDGRLDLIQAQGWFEQPATDKGEPWHYHPQAFSLSSRTAIGTARIAVYDVNGDGLNDVVTTLQPHDAGIAWFEQRRDSKGRISFDKHVVMEGLHSSNNAGGVAFTEAHGAAAADIDGDGIPDFITGKRYWSHHESQSDPDPYGPAVIYVYRTVRDRQAPGGARFEPVLVHNRSGVGSQVEVLDMNRDGRQDIVISGAKGTFVFWGKPRDADHASR